MNQLLKITALTLMLPVFVATQSSEKSRKPESVPVAKLLRAAFQKIKTQANAPIFLPSEFPSSVKANEIHLVDGQGTPDGWEISLYYKEGCGDACFVGYFEAKRGENVSRGEVDKVVPLAHGIKGYYTARSCGGSCAPPEINWVHGNVLYTIQFNVNNRTKTRDQAEIVALANSAILGGVR